MSREGPRPIFFFCAAIVDQDIVAEMVLGNTPAEASEAFEKQFGVPPKKILGPALKKRKQVIETSRQLTFTNQNQKAIHDGWLVNAFILKDPADHAYLVYLKRIDDKKMSPPKGVITVPVSDLNFSV
jgi:hypothetical protein